MEAREPALRPAGGVATAPPHPNPSISVDADADHESSPRVATTRVLAAIPCYNEERYIGSVVLQAKRFVDAVIVVDDGSHDATADIAAAAGATVLRHITNQGKAEALNTAFAAARRLNAAVLVLLDGDGQHRAEEIPGLVRPIEEGRADIVIGSRFLATAEGEIPRLRSLGQRAITGITNVGSGVAVTDSQSGYRAFSRRAIEVLVFKQQGFTVESEMQFLAKEHGLRVAEQPITAIYHPEQPKRNVFQQGTWVLNGVLRLVGQHRPLLFFGLPGMTFFLTGLALGIHVVDLYRESRTLAVGYAILTVLLGVIGMLSLFTAVLLHSIRAFILDLKLDITRRS